VKITEHLDYLDTYDEDEYLMYKLLFHGAPTIQGEKPASLITFKNNRSIRLKDAWERHKDTLLQLIDLDYIELKKTKVMVCVLFYNKDWLSKILKHDEIQEYLQAKGYGQAIYVEKALACLRHHYKAGCPNEIGVFLGYPLSDVKAFASDRKNESLLNGYWRVYSKVQDAIQIFNRYDMTRQKVSDRLAEGIRPKELLEVI